MTAQNPETAKSRELLLDAAEALMQESLVLMSHAEYQRLKSRDREVLVLSDFTDEERAAIALPA